MEPAPFFTEIADAGPDARAFWTDAPDGARVRLAHLGQGERGTVLLFPGRTEFVEKYGPAGRALADRGYGTLTIDWRGQGLTDRFLPDRRTGHIERFAEYQSDVAALLQAAGALGVPRPHFLLGHSMGGAIGLRAVLSGLPVAACVFSGPMWGIRIAAWVRPFAWSLSTMSRPLGQGGRVAPTASPGNYILESPFEGNMLTTDPEMYAWLKWQLQVRPELALGGPSLAWVNEALREVRALRRLPAPRMPGLCVVGENERIVEVEAMRRRMGGWPGGRLMVMPEAEHEVMMERERVRVLFYDAAAGVFDMAAARAA